MTKQICVISTKLNKNTSSVIFAFYDPIECLILSRINKKSKGFLSVKRQFKVFCKLIRQNLHIPIKDFNYNTFLKFNEKILRNLNEEELLETLNSFFYYYLCLLNGMTFIPKIKLTIDDTKFIYEGLRHAVNYQGQNTLIKELELADGFYKDFHNALVHHSTIKKLQLSLSSNPSDYNLLAELILENKSISEFVVDCCYQRSNKDCHYSLSTLFKAIIKVKASFSEIIIDFLYTPNIYRVEFYKFTSSSKYHKSLKMYISNFPFNIISMFLYTNEFTKSNRFTCGFVKGDNYL
jgi:hypothetical protein